MHSRPTKERQMKAQSDPTFREDPTFLVYMDLLWTKYTATYKRYTIPMLFLDVRRHLNVIQRAKSDTFRICSVEFDSVVM